MFFKIDIDKYRKIYELINIIIIYFNKHMEIFIRLRKEII